MRFGFLGRKIASEDGNVFIAIFGAVAMVGILGASVMTFMKGPLATSVKLTKMNAAENQMAIGAQVAVMATASQADNGDCDGDNTVEPVPFRSPATEPVPTGGGLVPLTVGISKKDPWGTEYGYCVWNHGSTIAQAGTCGANMLQGNNTVNYKVYPVVALVSAGPDKAFTTTCRSFATADVNGDFDLLDATDLQLISKAADTDDDIITTFTYDEATGASGGLWSIKSGEPDTAVIGKNIETTGTASLKGGLLLPDKSFVTCDSSTAGVMAMNGSAIEICNGTTWDAITGGASAVGGGLVLTPNVSTGMNVTGGCGTSTCYSTNQTFTLTNNLSPASPSDTLVTTLSNTANFEFVSNNCSGQVLAAGANCMMVVRAKATGNMPYAGTLNVVGNNSPIATLDGTASSFAGCNAGGQGPGGYYVACGVSGSYDLIITPSNCTGGNTNPICNGANGDVAGITDSGAIDLATYAGSCCGSGITSGQSNTATLVGYSGGIVSFPAASYCDGMVYGGYDDWFLPSIHEMTNYFYPLRNTVGWAAGGNYVTSSIQNPAPYFWWYLQGSNGSSQSVAGTNNGRYIRCMRRDPAVAAVAAIDNTPLTVTFRPSYGAPSETRTSNTVNIYGVTRPVSISVSGSGSPRYSVNGGAYTSATGTVTNGDQITLQATSPALGIENSIGLTVGTANSTWLVRTPGNNTIRIFTSSTTSNGTTNHGSVCAARASAAGLPGTWIPLVSSSPGHDIANIMPWNWKTLKNMNNNLVATSVADYMDGSISAPFNFTETGALTSSRSWSGVSVSGSSMNTTGREYTTCSEWATSSPGADAWLANPGATSGAYYIGGAGAAEKGLCNASYSTICIESNAAGADTDPNAVAIQPRVTFVSGGTGTSNTVTITGVTDEIPVEIVPSAGTADIIKDGASVGATTTMAGLNQTLSFTLTAPTTLGQRNTATVTLGPDSYTWWVGYADGAKETKAFVGALANAGNTGGLSGADARCNALAASSSLGLSGSWRAMMSDSTTDMADRIPWNWGILRDIAGGTIVDGGYTDLLDGSLDGPINWNQNGNPVNATAVATGFNASGMRSNGTASSGYACNWTDGSNSCGSGPYGHSNSAGSSWASQGTTGSAFVYHLYCIENLDNVTDTTPTAIDIPYAIQVPTSSRQSSSSVVIGGMSAGATTTLSVSATGGTPTFKVNGGAEVTSAAVRNGDSIIFLMDAPAVGNASNRMTISLESMTFYWRVWTGDTTGSVSKRIFVGNIVFCSSVPTSISGIDARCNSLAASAGLGGTWKGVVSGFLENDWAVNRIGYNWSTLERVDGTDVVLSGNIWSTATLPLLSAPVLNELGNVVSDTGIRTNTSPAGKAVSTSGTGACADWTQQQNSSASTITGSSGTSSSAWINNGSSTGCGFSGCGNVRYYYCVEQ